MKEFIWRRRDLLRLGAKVGGLWSLSPTSNCLESGAGEGETRRPSGPPPEIGHEFNGTYEGTTLDQIAFPLGGIGAGMFCVEGTGALTKFSLRHQPNLKHEPIVYAALAVKTPKKVSRVLEGPVPARKLHPQFLGKSGMPPVADAMWGLPRFQHAGFVARFPFATVCLNDELVPLKVSLTGWSPFCPGDADNASLPVAGLEYTFVNSTNSPVEAVFSFNAQNFMAEPQSPFNPDPNPKSMDRIRATEGGFVLYGAGARDRSWEEGFFAAWVTDSATKINHAWFSGGLGLLFDSPQMVWNDIDSGKCYARDPLLDAPALGASIFVPFTLAAGQTKTVTLCLAWYVPSSNVHSPDGSLREGVSVSYTQGANYRPWYADRFADIEEVKRYWQERYASLRKAAEKFVHAFYGSTLPPEVIEAVAANLTILKSPTVLRQPDGRVWGWEGVGDEVGTGGPGSCTHVWNYAQALPHLFPELERGLRETEFGPNQGKDGFQVHRAALPIRPIADTEEGRAMPPVADGQLGGIIKTFREWRISGNTSWLHGLWPQIRASIDYCIRTWDPKRRGWIEEAHLTTYDVKLWGADSLCTGLYLGALKAATLMGAALGDDVAEYSALLKNGLNRIEEELFNGEYFFQKTEWQHLRQPFPAKPDAWADAFQLTVQELELSKMEGPPYQYGTGCLSDGLLGQWLCLVSGLGDLLDRSKTVSHLIAVHRYNLRRSFSDRATIGGSFLATREESGLLVCSWPRGGRPLLPVIYADEVWTGSEYQVASHLIALGKTGEGLDIVRAARRRYDGRLRNPFAEIEGGQWYARAMSSYALLQAFSGARFDAVEKTLYLSPSIKGDFRCFLSTATGFGTVGVKNGRPFVEIVSGEIPFRSIHYTPA